MIQFASSVTRYFFRQKKCAILSGILLIGFIPIGITDAQDAIRPADLKPEKDQVFFNQTDLDGWSAKDMDLWSVEEGAIVGTGGDAKIKGNQFLYSKIPVKNFRLKLKVKQVPYSANAGIQFRSTELKPSGQAVGYQADVGKGWWGSLYHEHGRGILVRNGDTSEKHVHREGWNDYEILAVDHRIWLAVNGRITVALEDPDGELTGLLALQIHGGPGQRVAYKNLELTHNPELTIAGLGGDDLRKTLKRLEGEKKNNSSQ
ncbi:MAG: 3-keto-disaccharide hydrolase [Mariniblastus sp.]